MVKVKSQSGFEPRASGVPNLHPGVSNLHRDRWSFETRKMINTRSL